MTKMTVAENMFPTRMMRHRFTLEKYRGGRGRHTCPACGAGKEFSRYVDTWTGQYLADNVGRCNREAKCGYHYTPRQFFADNPAADGGRRDARPLEQVVRKSEARELIKTDFIRSEILKGTLGDYGRNGLVKFLCSRLSCDVVSAAIKHYLVGTWKGGRTVFWQVDYCGRIRTGKLMAYDPTTGKRMKSPRVSWVHAELKRAGRLPEAFRLRQCFFGEHLVAREPGKPVAVVESEKTAVVASLFMPEYLWLATGGCKNLDTARLTRAGKGRRVALFPDSSKFAEWSAKAEEARRRYGLDVRVSDLFERRLTEEQKREDYDIADFLLASGVGKCPPLNREG